MTPLEKAIKLANLRGGKKKKNFRQVCNGYAHSLSKRP